MITKEFETMLYMFGCGARGHIYNNSLEGNIDKIFNIASKQSIWQTVYLALPEGAVKEKLKMPFLMSYQKNMQKIRFTLETIKKMEEAGISCCLMKGIAVSRLYKEPLCRVSGDSDILINEKKEKKAMSVLKELGYNVEERGRNAHHFLARHPVGGLLEIHVKMYSDPTKDILFENKLKYNEEHTTVEIDGYKIKTFGITDNAVYLTAHYIKHFISRGVGVRQLMDLLLYLEAYKDTINWEKYNKLFSELSYTKLINSLFAIGNKYFGFSFDTEDSEIMDLILEDTEKGGTFGYNNEDSKEFYEVFTAQKTSMNDREYTKYMYEKRNSSFIRKLFPIKPIMEKNGYHSKNSFELCLRYIQRLFDIVISIITGKKNVKKIMTYETKQDINENTKKRLDMMKNLEII